jgi:hypothetical protein
VGKVEEWGDAMNEADARFAERLAEELEPILGPEIVLDELDLGDAEALLSRIHAVCLFAGGSESLEAVGETRLEAYNKLVLAVAELRITVAVRHMMFPSDLRLPIGTSRRVSPAHR